jgi:hypothetical protein
VILALLLACAPQPADTGSPAVDTAPVPWAPTKGAYAVTVADAWDGDCDFDDPATYEAPAQEWTFDPRGDVLIVYRDFWTPTACTLDGAAFGCDDGSWEEGRMQVTRRVEGEFPDEASVRGALVVELDCGGTGCDTLQDTYGRRLDFPCRSEAAFEGTLD